MVCAAVAVIPPDVLVESTTGQLIAPRLPIDVCAQPQQQVLTALRALPWTTVSSRPIHQLETQAEVVSGCPPAAKDLFTFQAGQLYPSPGGPVFPAAPTSVTVCVYRDVGSPPGPQIGKFAGAGTLTGAAATSVLDGISSGRASTNCALPHSSFAVLWTAAGGRAAYVELGGCDRVLTTTLRPATPGPPTAPAGGPPPAAGAQREQVGQASPAAIATLSRIAAPGG